MCRLLTTTLFGLSLLTAGIQTTEAQYRTHNGYGPLLPRTNYYPGYTIRYDRGMQDSTRDGVRYDGVRTYVPDPTPQETNTLLPYSVRLGKDRYIFYERWQRVRSPKVPGADAGFNQVK